MWDVFGKRTNAKRGFNYFILFYITIGLAASTLVTTQDLGLAMHEKIPNQRLMTCHSTLSRGDNLTGYGSVSKGLVY